jgi:hypothetical protein
MMSLFPPPDYHRPSVWFANTPQAKTPQELSDFERLTQAVQHYAEMLFRQRDRFWKSPAQSVMLDWRISNTKLIADFKKLIKAERKKLLSAAAQYKRVARTAGTGRRRDVGRLLVDIALIRADAAGFTRPAAIELLAPLLQHFQLLPQNRETKDGLFSEKNWSATLKKAAKTLWSYKL